MADNDIRRVAYGGNIPYPFFFKNTGDVITLKNSVRIAPSTHCVSVTKKRQCAYNVTLMRVRVTIVVVEKQ